MSSAHTVNLGSALSLSLTVPDGVSGLFPRAFVYDQAGSAVAGSPFNLTEVGTTGRYISNAYTPTAEGTYTALYIVYSDSGHTVEATIYSHAQDAYFVYDFDDITTQIQSVGFRVHRT